VDCSSFCKLRGPTHTSQVQKNGSGGHEAVVLESRLYEVFRSEMERVEGDVTSEELYAARTADRVEELGHEARKAMALKHRLTEDRLLYGPVHSRQVKAPVHCAGCHTVYEGSEVACPACTDTVAIGPVTELSMLIAKIRERS